MATITSRLTLTGTGTTSDVLNIIKEKALTITSPAVQVGTVTLTASFATTLDDLNGTKNATSDTFLYIMNTSSGTETVHAQVVATQAGCTDAEGETCTLTQSPLVKLAKGEFAMIPLEAAAHVQFKGSATTAVMEYGFWTRSV